MLQLYNKFPLSFCTMFQIQKLTKLDQQIKTRNNLLNWLDSTQQSSQTVKEQNCSNCLGWRSYWHCNSRMSQKTRTITFTLSKTQFSTNKIIRFLLYEGAIHLPLHSPHFVKNGSLIKGFLKKAKQFPLLLLIKTFQILVRNNSQVNHQVNSKMFIITSLNKIVFSNVLLWQVNQIIIICFVSNEIRHRNNYQLDPYHNDFQCSYPDSQYECQTSYSQNQDISTVTDKSHLDTYSYPPAQGNLPN